MKKLTKKLIIKMSGTSFDIDLAKRMGIIGKQISELGNTRFEQRIKKGNLR